MKVREEQRICFGLTWYDDLAEAEAAARVVREAGLTFNGGWFDGKPCGRETEFDYTMPDGTCAYAVSD